MSKKKSAQLKREAIQKQALINKQRKQFAVKHGLLMNDDGSFSTPIRKQTTTRKSNSIYRRETQIIPSHVEQGPICTGKNEPLKYTGTFIKGIATMHKSNLVPITSQEEAESVSKMRRN